MDWITGNYITLAIVIAFGITMVFYLRAEKHNDGVHGFKKATTLKLTLSAMFCAVGVISYLILVGGNTHMSNIYYVFKFLIVAALFASLVGDYYLQYIRLDVKKFKIGIFWFSLAQVLIIVSMIALEGINWREIVATIGLLIVALILMRKQDWQLKEEKRAVMIYTVLLAFMASKAFMDMLDEPTVGTLLLAIGGALFFLSDLLLGLWNYYTNKQVHAYLNWISYFSALMLIALSISPEFFTPLFLN